MKLLLELFVFMAVGMFFGWLALQWNPEMGGGLAFLCAFVPSIAVVGIGEQLFARKRRSA